MSGKARVSTPPAVTPWAPGLRQALHRLPCIELDLRADSRVTDLMHDAGVGQRNGYVPTLAVEFGRKLISAVQRPSFAKMESHFKQQKAR
ncbi:hypothetical protein [Duganella margarita]|uniref:hypothetical protein n=1 Tax=Duganella margarita TaxID=2692170 RepID=UPI001925B305|nr:hypothetical protein [Duganella margarita]